MNLKKGDQFYINNKKDIMTIINPNNGDKYYNIIAEINGKICQVDSCIFTYPHVERVEEEEII
jgi:hypothetical protein